jgi:aminocarboxymuconate-semialdehyde decarboxylase
MRTIDIHAHLVPQSLWRAVEAGVPWHGYRHEPGDGLGTVVGGGRRIQFNSPKVRFTPEERLADMDAQGVDVQVISIHTPIFGYHLDAAGGRALAREVNDEIAGMTRQWPRRFAGLATLPVQDVKTAIDELERAVTVLGLKGAELDTVVNGENWDEPKYLPLFKAAESMGAVLFFHPQPQHNFMAERMPRPRAVQQPGRHRRGRDRRRGADPGRRSSTRARPSRRVSPTAAGPRASRWAASTAPGGPFPRRAGASPSRRARISGACTTTRWSGSEEALRFLLDRVGADRVVLGSDWPFVPWYPSPVTWVEGLASLSRDEKDQILWRNLEALLKL